VAIIIIIITIIITRALGRWGGALWWVRMWDGWVAGLVGA